MSNHCGQHTGVAKKFVIVLMEIVIMAVILHWSWNNFAVEILGQQQIAFKHALSVEFSVLTLTGSFPIVWKFFASFNWHVENKL